MNNSYLTAKRYIAESIYHMTKLYGLNTTFPETKSLLDGGVISNMDIHDVTVITNLKRAWQCLLNDTLNEEYNIDKFIDIKYFERINAIVGWDLVIDAGCIRDSIPSEKFTTLKLDEIRNCDDKIQQVLEIICFGIKSQQFYDANKRTSFLVANALLVKYDIGIIYVEENKFPKFNELLTIFLLDNNVEPLKEFLYHGCITYQPKYTTTPLSSYKSILGYVSEKFIV